MFNMFGKLKEDAARIDREIGTLASKLPEVMYGYTDANSDPQAIVDRRTKDVRRDVNEMRAFLSDVAAFEKLLDEHSEATAEEERALRKFAQAHRLEHCLVADDLNESITTDPEQEDEEDSPGKDNQGSAADSAPDSPFERLFIGKPDQEAAACTPAFRTTGSKKKQPQTRGSHVAAPQTRLRF